MTTETQIERAQRQFEQARARLRQLKNRESVKKRKADTRRKILLGGLLIKHARQNPAVERQIREMVEELSERDKKVFTGWKPAEIRGNAPTPPSPGSGQP